MPGLAVLVRIPARSLLRVLYRQPDRVPVRDWDRTEEQPVVTLQIQSRNSEAVAPAGVLAQDRFAVLDSLRGIAAITVVLFHAQIVSNLRNLEIVRSGELLVDFFFVLSGFVIAHAYLNRIADRRGFGEFLLLRLGRLYPLHLFMLALFVGFELAKSAMPGFGNASDPAFTGTNEPQFLISNLLLLQDVWPTWTLTWNTPSWSISAEYVVYVAFAVVALCLRRRVGWTVAAAVVVAPVLISAFADDGMETTSQLGLVRALFGFAAGVLLYLVVNEWIATRRSATAGAGETSLLWTAAELAALDAILLVLGYGRGTPLAYLAPFVFAAAIAVFAVEAGHLSRLLKMRFFIFIGALSYSIYLTHMFVLLRFTNLARLSDSALGTSLLQRVGETERYGDGIDPGNLLVGDGLVVLVVVLTIAMSYLTYRFIELPGRNACRLLAKRLFGQVPRERAMQA